MALPIRFQSDDAVFYKVKIIKFVLDNSEKHEINSVLLIFSEDEIYDIEYFSEGDKVYCYGKIQMANVDIMSPYSLLEIVREINKAQYSYQYKLTEIKRQGVINVITTSETYSYPIELKVFPNLYFNDISGSSKFYEKNKIIYNTQLKIGTNEAFSLYDRTLPVYMIDDSSDKIVDLAEYSALYIKPRSDNLMIAVIGNISTLLKVKPGKKKMYFYYYDHFGPVVSSADIKFTDDDMVIVNIPMPSFVSEYDVEMNEPTDYYGLIRKLGIYPYIYVNNKMYKVQEIVQKYKHTSIYAKLET
ncbi:MAG: hypothetical protein KatS3mg083_089 [Candidatus Dojkabacteria bacterium]|nr:MAG: hypothetical protein KatS3mg083_089 [Candidatus Dojkabacteria bacterium]